MLQGGAVIANHYADGLVVFLNERKSGIGLLLSGALDGDGRSRIQGFGGPSFGGFSGTGFKVSKLRSRTHVSATFTS